MQGMQNWARQFATGGSVECATCVSTEHRVEEQPAL